VVRIDPVEASSFKPDFEPGVYLAEVKDSLLKHSSKNGDQYFGVELESSGLDGMKKRLCQDVLMLEGKGASMGVAKLRALGFFEDGTAQDIDAHELVGKRCWVRVDWQHYEDRKTGERKKSLKPYASFQPFDCGYYHESHPPEDAASAIAIDDPFGGPDVDDSKVPF
jgi:hypothetical protein